jgi:hypothetical protein
MNDQSHYENEELFYDDYAQGVVEFESYDPVSSPLKTTTREEWSYILLVLHELLLMSYDSFLTRLWKSCGKRA